MPRIETGHPVTADVSVVDAQSVRFVTDDGRTMFEVGWCDNKRSIQVRAVETTKVDGDLYSGMIDIRPKCGNTIIVMVREYDDQS